MVFCQALRFDFVDYDDGTYIYQNPEVANGLTAHGIVWAFTHIHGSNWHPLTWISHMADCQFYGLNAGGHHLTSILLHAANAVLLFSTLCRLTGALWRSGFVAAVFAIHPLRVESVVWVSERKDLLSGLFFMLTILAYVSYARHSRSLAHYARVVVLFALGLMCKPMLVSLPFVLLLLDYWPLRRMGENSKGFRAGKTPFPIPWQLVFEKLPLFGLAIASCAVTIFAQQGAIQPFEKLPVFLRTGNALIAYLSYLTQMFWPAHLAPSYLFASANVTTFRVLAAATGTMLISITAFVLRFRYPYFLVGWFWYLIMLLPVIGLVQVGSQAMADRYTYLPQIGIYVSLTWLVVDLLVIFQNRRLVLIPAAAAILTALALCARHQVTFWRNGESLWRHTLACSSNNTIARENLGNILFQRNDLDAAINQFQLALQSNPELPDVYYDLGNAFIAKGELDAAIGCYQKALQFEPNYSEAYNNLGYVYLQKGDLDAAAESFMKAQQFNPGNAQASYNLGHVLLKKGNLDEAIIHLQRAAQMNPQNAETYCDLGEAVLRQGNVKQAISYFQKSLQIDPGLQTAQTNLANCLAK